LDARRFKRRGIPIKLKRKSDADHRIYGP